MMIIIIKIIVDSYKESQQVALFLNFILIDNSTRCGQTSLAYSQHNKYDKHQLL